MKPIDHTWPGSGVQAVGSKRLAAAGGHAVPASGPATRSWQLPSLKDLAKSALPIVDFFIAPFVYPAALLLKAIRTAGLHRMPCSKRALLHAGVLPVRDHYFEPLINSKHLRHPLDRDRLLPGISWNVDGQLRLLERFSYNDELLELPASSGDELAFSFDNAAFCAGDAEFLYNLIRLKKPARIFEIGSGHSTRMAMRAIRKNQEEDASYHCKHLCVEPYEQPWLEKAGIALIRERVEELGPSFFSELAENDLLFIDSSHVIRPQGDVLFEYLELLPTLKRGVIVHVHDIFSPRDYPEAWVKDEVRLWNEQYLLEAFLTDNSEWRILGALNYLHHSHYPALLAKCPYLTANCEPGSFYFQKIR